MPPKKKELEPTPAQLKKLKERAASENLDLDDVIEEWRTGQLPLSKTNNPWRPR